MKSASLIFAISITSLSLLVPSQQLVAGSKAELSGQVEGPDKSMLEKARPWIKALPQSPPDPDGLVVLPYLAWGDYKKANKLIVETIPYGYKTPQEKWGYWNLYELLHAWMLYKDHLDRDAREYIERAVGIALDPQRRVLKNLGFNTNGSCVNHPISCTAIAMIGGEQFGNKEAAKRAYRGLDQFADVWSGAGSYREYNSPTYQAVDFVALATIRQFSTNPVAALKAKILEERLWLETASRYHAASWTLSGPYSRAYHWDSIGGATDMQYCFHRVIGKQIPLSFDVTEKLYRMDHRLSWVGRSASLTFSCPEYARKLALSPPQDFQFQTSVGGDPILSDLVTYMNRDFSLGTCSQRCPRGSQNQDFVAHWRRTVPVIKHADIRSLFFKPLERNGDHYHLQSQGRAIAVGCLATRNAYEGLRRIGCQIHLAGKPSFDEIRVGYKKVKQLPSTRTNDDLIALRDGLVYVAIRPLSGTRWGELAQPVRINASNFQSPITTISLLNYQGPPRSFTQEEVARTYHGFCIEIASATDYPSFDLFCQQANEWNIHSENTNEGICSVNWHYGKKSLSLKIDRKKRTITDRRIDGKLFQRHMMESLLTRMDTSGEITRNGASLLTKPGVPVILHADPSNKAFVAMNPTNEPTPISLTTPSGVVRINSLTFGKVEFLGEAPVRVNIEAVTVDPSNVEVTPVVGQKLILTINGIERKL